jgi:hypothetical protein
MHIMETTMHPIAASADGKQNAHFHRCVTVGFCRAYAACLSLIDQRKLGPLNVNNASCSDAMRNNTCPAVGMREEEELMGNAIYFVQNIKVEIPTTVDPKWVFSDALNEFIKTKAESRVELAD